jgi:hypothetical protein
VPPRHACAQRGPASSEVTRAICLVPSTSFSQRLGILCQSTCVGFGYGLMLELFPGTASSPGQSDKPKQFTRSVTSSWPRNVDLVPIDYGFRPHLRGRLTLRGLPLRRNPWTFGDGVSHSVSVTHVSILTSDTSRAPPGYPFTGLRNAPLPLNLGRYPG